MVDFMRLGLTVLKILQNEWRIACTRSALSVLDDAALRDIGLTRVQIWQTEETPCVHKGSKSYPYHPGRVNRG